MSLITVSKYDDITLKNIVAESPEVWETSDATHVRVSLPSEIGNMLAMQDMGYCEELGRINNFTGMILKSQVVETLYVCDTFQFNDYSLYDAELFDPAHKAAMRETLFPQDCTRAFELGKKIAGN